jgi:hypothetical protein
VGVRIRNADGIGGSDGNSWKRGMIYDSGTPLGGVWHYPFPRWWVEMMKRAAKHCERLSADYIERTLNNEWMSYSLPPGDFLSEPQDARGLPLSWCRREEERHKNWPKCCVSIYDYDTISDMVVTNGEEDRPYTSRYRMMTA